jgi:hypothetical protein
VAEENRVKCKSRNCGSSDTWALFQCKACGEMYITPARADAKGVPLKTRCVSCTSPDTKDATKVVPKAVLRDGVDVNTENEAQAIWCNAFTCNWHAGTRPKYVIRGR